MIFVKSSIKINMNITFKKLISMFLDGAIEGVAGTKNNPGNLKIKGQQLLHYNTVILEKRESELIVNLTRYSIQTGRLQKQIKEELEKKDYVIVTGIPRDYAGSLFDYKFENSNKK